MKALAAWRLAAAAVLLAATASCRDILQYPETPEAPEPEPTRLVVHFDHETDMPLYQSIVRSSRATRCETYSVRHVVAVYPLGTSPETDTRNPSRGDPITLVDTYAENEFDIDGRDMTVTLPSGNYEIFAWTDYLPTTSGVPFYIVEDFAAITLSDLHRGCDMHRQAFRGYTAVTVPPEQTVTATVPMVMPMARFRFISIDIREFVENQALNSSGRATDIDPDDYRVLFRYTAYLPSVFNVFIDHPTNSRTGVSFDGRMEWISDEEMELGHDFVLTNGANTSVDVAVEVYDRQGTLLARSPSLNVPLLRGHLTEVRGKFLTTAAAGGTLIDPDFNGEYNIEIK